MAPQKLTDYEHKRLENIRRNDEMMAALKLHSKAARVEEAKFHYVKPKIHTPMAIRRSLRNLKLPPPSKTQPLGPLSMADARQGTHSHTSFLQSLIPEKLDAMPKSKLPLAWTLCVWILRILHADTTIGIYSGVNNWRMLVLYVLTIGRAHPFLL